MVLPVAHFTHLPQELVQFVASFDRTPQTFTALRRMTKLFHQFLPLDSINNTLFFSVACKGDVKAIKQLVHLVHNEKVHKVCEDFFLCADNTAKQLFWSACETVSAPLLFPFIASCPKGFDRIEDTGSIAAAIELFSISPTVRALSLSKETTLSREVVGRFEGALRSHPELRELHIGRVGEVHVRNFPWKILSQLRVLEFAYESETSDQLVDLLAERFLMPLPCLEVLRIAAYPIGIEDSFPHPEQLASLHHLRFFDMGGLQLTADIVTILSELPLESLSVQWFTINALAYLPKLTHLITLNIGIEGIYNHTLMCESLRSLTTLKSLRVSSAYHGLSYDIYADFLTMCPWLEEFVVVDLELDFQQDAAALAHALEFHPSLKTLSMQLHRPPETLLSAIARNQNIRVKDNLYDCI